LGQHEPEPQIKSLAADLEIDDDPEVNYFFAAPSRKLRANQRVAPSPESCYRWNYRSYPAMDLDPLFGKIRTAPEFGNLRAAGIACHANFAANREQGHRIAVSQHWARSPD